MNMEKTVEVVMRFDRNKFALITGLFRLFVKLIIDLKVSLNVAFSKLSVA